LRAVEALRPAREKRGLPTDDVHVPNLDSACGYAAFSLLPAEAAVLTVEFKINLLRPAAGERFVARARVLKPGKTLTVCTGEVVAVAGGTEKVVASMMNTIMRLPDRE
jgi:uncharacterized protein (TIGR00369 family)